MEHLHRYFDYAMIGRAAGGTGRDKSMLQWAVLQLASVHFRLGHMQLSLLALEEAVRLAQHASDHHCLATALVISHTYALVEHAWYADALTVDLQKCFLHFHMASSICAAAGRFILAANCSMQKRVCPSPLDICFA
jgi:hypothetical protein